MADEQTILPRPNAQLMVEYVRSRTRDPYDERFAAAPSANRPVPVKGNGPSVDFYWVPRKLRPFDVASAESVKVDAMRGVAEALLEQLESRGDVEVEVVPQGSRPTCFRLRFTSDHVQPEDIDAILDRINDRGRSRFG